MKTHKVGSKEYQKICDVHEQLICDIRAAYDILKKLINTRIPMICYGT